MEGEGITLTADSVSYYLPSTKNKVRMTLHYTANTSSWRLQHACAHSIVRSHARIIFVGNWENLDLQYGKRRKALLRGVSLTAKPGQLMYIMGPSGAGKSTLLDLLAGRLTTGEDGRVDFTALCAALYCRGDSHFNAARHSVVLMGLPGA